MSNMLNESYTLSNGVTIPKLGLGTWLIDDDKAAQAVRVAVAIGYRNIDTAEAYGNERGVGEGIRTCGVDRKDIFDKLWKFAHEKMLNASGEYEGYFAWHVTPEGKVIDANPASDGGQ